MSLARALSLMALLVAAARCDVVAAQDLAGGELTVRVGYLAERPPPPPTLSGLDPVPADEGIAGARLGLADNATTGRFLGHAYVLEEGDAPDILLVDAPADRLLAVADARPGALVINVSAQDMRLRDGDCRANILHTAPSRAMRADALMQLAVSRRWTDLALLSSDGPGDAAWGDALRAAASKFGARIRSEAAWTDGGDLRRSAGREIAAATRGLGEHDLLVVADESDDIARYVPFNAWLPRPVAGSAGLRSEAWFPVVEAYGAVQLQARFRDMAGRDMRPIDFAAWSAMRAIGEAVTRTGSAEPATLRAHLLSPDFELGVHLGRPASFRPWNGQMRAPIPLAHPRAVVAAAPLDGFLHARTELDTLGLDEGDSECSAF